MKNAVNVIEKQVLAKKGLRDLSLSSIFWGILIILLGIIIFSASLGSSNDFLGSILLVIIGVCYVIPGIFIYKLKNLRGWVTFLLVINILLIFGLIPLLFIASCISCYKKINILNDKNTIMASNKNHTYGYHEIRVGYNNTGIKLISYEDNLLISIRINGSFETIDEHNLLKGKASLIKYSSFVDEGGNRFKFDDAIPRKVEIIIMQNNNPIDLITIEPHEIKAKY